MEAFLAATFLEAGTNIGTAAENAAVVASVVQRMVEVVSYRSVAASSFANHVVHRQSSCFCDSTT